MYNDYPTIYETTINEYIIYYIIFGIVALALVIFTYISLAKIFKKANRSGISAFIPFYNIFVLLEIVNLPKWYFVLLLIPLVNIVIYIKIMFSLARFFRKSKLFAVGLIIAPFIYYPILGFNRSEYMGINIVAMEGKSQVVEVPKIVNEEENNPTVNETVDEGSRNINISIGGGVYQKNYTNTLLDVDKQQAIIDNQPKKQNVEPQLINQTNTFVTKIQEEPKPQQPTNNYGIEFPGLIPNNPSQQQPVINNQPIGINNPTPINNTQSQPKTEFMSCPKCGATIKSNSKTCFLCGRRLD